MYKYINILLFMCVSSYAYSQNILNQNIDGALKNACLDQNKTSVRVVEMPSGHIVYDYNSLKPLLAASVTKLITTASALHYLSPEYRFKTTILHTGQKRKGSINGHLVIRGGGDPFLSTKDLWKIATQLKASGIDEVTGDLLIDLHFFDSYNRAPAWDVTRSDWAYDAKIGALSLNFNSIAVHVKPGAYAGDKVSAWIEPSVPYMRLSNSAKTIKRGRNTVSIKRSETASGYIKLQLRGKLPIRSREKLIRLNVLEPMRYASETFNYLLKKAGIRIKGKTKVVYRPVAGKALYTHLSPPLSLILKELNTFSNNLTAEQITKTIAAVRYGTPGTHAEALRLTRQFLTLSRVDLRGVTLVDGSGLSRKNRMTTHAITDLLTRMYSRFDIGPDFMAVLRVMGAYGVLSSRLKKSPAKGKIRAKTGTLRGVSTLAGYVATPAGKVFGYAIFLNHNRCGGWKADQIEDKIVNSIYRYGRTYLNTAQR